MNEYFVEDEFSFYEIDPGCKIGIEKELKRNQILRRTGECQKEEDCTDGHTEAATAETRTDGCNEAMIVENFSEVNHCQWKQRKKTEKIRKSSRPNQSCCSLLVILCVLFLSGCINGQDGPCLRKMPDRKR